MKYKTIMVFTLIGIGFGDGMAAVHRASLETGIQGVVDIAAPGDIIEIMPGVYHESVTIANAGSPGSPIVIRAATGGTVTISGADPEWAAAPPRFERVEGDLFKAPFPRKVDWLMANGRIQWPYDSLQGLKTFRQRNEWAPPEGFFWHNGELFVRLKDGTDPNEALIEIARPDGGSNLSVLADHIVVEGLRLHMAGTRAALACGGTGITIRDCYLSGTKHGIWKSHGADFVVEYNEFSGYPFHEWKREHYEFWKIAYGFINFMNVSGPRAIVRHNLAYDFFDGIGIRPDNASDPVWSVCAYNFLSRGNDDIFEFDSWTPLRWRIHHNVVMDALVLFALSPVLGGDLRIDHNIGYLSPEGGFQGSTFFKFCNPWEWKAGEAPTRGCTIVHNTLVYGAVNNGEGWGGIYWGGENWLYADNVMENNLFQTFRSQPWKLYDYRFSRHNAMVGTGVDPMHLPPVIWAADAGFRSDDPLDVHLRPESVAVDAGVARIPVGRKARGRAPDLGAIELGDEWIFPTPGPRWVDAAHIARRPPWPESFDLRLAGLAPGQQPLGTEAMERVLETMRRFPPEDRTIPAPMTQVSVPIRPAGLDIGTLPFDQADLVVAPDGDDAHAGTLEQPLATPAEAVARVRRMLADQRDRDILVVFAAGEYELDMPLAIGVEDSGGERHSVVYAAQPDDTVVFSGGRRMVQWDTAVERFLTAPARRMPHAIFADGRRLFPTRYPAPADDSAKPYFEIAEVAFDASLRCIAVRLTPDSLVDISDVSNLALLTLGKWAGTRLPIDRIDKLTGWLHLQPPFFGASIAPWNAPAPGMRAVIEGVMSVPPPGHWSYDAAGERIVYRPPDGRNVGDVEIVVPRLKSLLVIEGEADRPVRNVHFVGIRFAYTDWSAPDSAIRGIRGGDYFLAGDDTGLCRPQAAIVLRYAERCGIIQGELAHVGGNGIDIGDGSRENRVEAMAITDIGGCAVVVGGPPDVTPAAISGNTIAGVSIERGGSVMPGAPGIWVSDGHHTLIESNRLSVLPHTAILIGKPNRPDAPPMDGTRIRGNIIRDVGRELGDGGGIQVFGPQINSEMTANRIEAVTPNPLPYADENAGLLFDAGSGDMRIEDNHVTAHPPLRFHDARRSDFEFADNAFGAEGRAGQGLSVLYQADWAEFNIDEPAGIDLTVMCWIRWTHPMHFPDWPKHIVFRHPFGDRWFLGVGKDGRIVGEFHVAQQGGVGASGANRAIEKNRWHHLAMTFDGRTLRLFLDGEADGEGVSERELSREPEVFRVTVGRRVAGWPPFRGIVDDVRIYDRVLTPAEIARIAGEPADAKPSTSLRFSSRVATP